MSSSPPSRLIRRRICPLDFPRTGRLAAVDYGTARIGVAVCDPDRILASPLTVVAGQRYAHHPESFTNIAREERLVAWVVGLPIHADGNESPSSIAARKFGTWLADQTRLPVRLFDERFTTVEANARLRTGGRISRQKKQKRIDAVAATVLLESFLEACRYRGTIAGVDVGEPVAQADDLNDRPEASGNT